MVLPVPLPGGRVLCPRRSSFGKVCLLGTRDSKSSQRPVNQECDFATSRGLLLPLGGAGREGPGPAPAQPSALASRVTPAGWAAPWGVSAEPPRPEDGLNPPHSVQCREHAAARVVTALILELGLCSAAALVTLGEARPCPAGSRGGRDPRTRVPLVLGPASWRVVAPGARASRPWTLHQAARGLPFSRPPC